MDEGTYAERVTRVAHMMDVRTAFASNAQVQEALQVRTVVPPPRTPLPRLASLTHTRRCFAGVQTLREHEAGTRVVPGAWKLVHMCACVAVAHEKRHPQRTSCTEPAS